MIKMMLLTALERLLGIEMSSLQAFNWVKPMTSSLACRMTQYLKQVLFGSTLQETNPLQCSSELHASYTFTLDYRDAFLRLTLHEFLVRMLPISRNGWA
jgi:hypothetical protein